MVEDRRNETPGGLEQEARDAAERAARDSGQSLQDWLNQAIREAGTPAGGDVDAGEAARDAAEAAGMPVGDWLTQMIRDSVGAAGVSGGTGDPSPDAKAAAPDATEEDEAAAEAATRAAAASGLSLGEWLSHAIRESAQPPAAEVEEPERHEEPPPADDIRRWARILPVGRLSPGRFQTRERIMPGEVDALAESIRDHGVLQPVLVRRHPDLEESFEIIAGERRWRAARQAGLAEVPAVVLDLSDRDAMEVALVENLQRRDLNPLEEAEGYRRLIEEFTHTQDDLGRVVGRSRSHIANTLRLIRLPDEIKAMLAREELTAGHARALLGAPDPVPLARVVIEKGLNVRQTEELVQRALNPPEEPEVAEEKSADILSLERQLTHQLGMKVRINVRGERGTMTIRFRGYDGLGSLLSRLQKSS